VTRRDWLGWTALVAGLGAGGWFGYESWQDSKAVVANRPQPDMQTALDEELPQTGVTNVDLSSGVDPSFGTTPMARRVAILGLLNKRNGLAREVTLKPGLAVRIGDVVVRLRACDRTAPWEQQPYTGAFVQLDVRGQDRAWRRTFSGWLYKERPGLNVVLHPVYDVWVKSCAMTFPEGGPNSVKGGGVTENGADMPRSSAKKSPAAPRAARTPEPTASSTADDSNPT
jgi:hypothetical protein